MTVQVLYETLSGLLAWPMPQPISRVNRGNTLALRILLREFHANCAKLTRRSCSDQETVRQNQLAQVMRHQGEAAGTIVPVQESFRRLSDTYLGAGEEGCARSPKLSFEESSNRRDLL